MIVSQLLVIGFAFSVGLGASTALASTGLVGPDQPQVVEKPAVKASSAPVFQVEVVTPPVAPPAPVAAPVPQVIAPAPKPVVKAALKAVAPPAPAPVAYVPPAPIKCSRLDDAKIDWILQQVASTKSQHPELAAGATTIEQIFLGARGKNLCAAEAQILVTQVCADPAALAVLNQMLSQLPPFIRSSIGDPCQTNLVDALNRLGAYIPALKSEPS